MTALHILNLGAGVQSTALALLAAEGSLKQADGTVVQLDAAIFADTGEEPQDDGVSVYTHLSWLASKTAHAFPTLVRSVGGRLGDHLLAGRNSTGGRFAPIPAYTLRPDGTEGRTRRHCTREYKIDVVERAIRRDVLGLKPRQRIPKDARVHQYIGISLDEIGRMLRARQRPAKPWTTLHYPFCEWLAWTRADCRAYLKDRVPHRVPRSACTFCPYHSNEEWQAIKARNGADWKRAVQIDEALRLPGNVVNRNLEQQLFLHRSCKPLASIDFASDSNGEREMAGECEGMCGN